MSMDTFVEMDATLIEEGTLMEDFEKEVDNLQSAMARFVDKFGDDSKGAIGTVTLRVKIKCADPKEKVFHVVGSVDHKMPARPKRTTVALGGTGENGPILLCRKSGTDEESPYQAKLCTDAGEVLDPETGEVIK